MGQSGNVMQMSLYGLGGRSGQRTKKDEHRLVGGNGLRNFRSTRRLRSVAEDLKNLPRLVTKQVQSRKSN